MTNVLASTDDDGFGVIADTARRLVGQLVRFRKGEFVIGRDEGRLDGATLVAYRVWRCWQKWLDGQVVDSIFPEPGKPLPTSAEDIRDASGDSGEW
jgi:hypothetical protein